MKLSKRLLCGIAAMTLIGTAGAFAQAPKMEMTTDIPSYITTPDRIESRIGELNFTDGYPDDATTQTLYDNLDFMRGVDAFLNAMPGASAEALRVGWGRAGADNNQTVLIFEDLMDSRSLFLTGNTESIVTPKHPLR